MLRLLIYTNYIGISKQYRNENIAAQFVLNKQFSRFGISGPCSRSRLIVKFEQLFKIHFLYFEYSWGCEFEKNKHGIFASFMNTQAN